MNTTTVLLQAELAQARKQVQALIAEREQYVRLSVCLANLIRCGVEAKIVNGHVAVDLADYVAVPTMWQVGIEQGNVKAADAPGDAKGEDVIVVIITEKPKLAAPVLNGKPRILVP